MNPDCHNTKSRTARIANRGDFLRRGYYAVEPCFFGIQRELHRALLNFPLLEVPLDFRRDHHALPHVLHKPEVQERRVVMMSEDGDAKDSGGNGLGGRNSLPRRCHHLDTTEAMHREHVYAETDRHAARFLHLSRKVMKLKVKENSSTSLKERPHGSRTVGGEEC